MILAERDQRIAVPGSDGAGVLVGHVDARERQADVVYHVGEIFRRDHASDGVLDVLEQTCGLLDACAWLGAHVHQDLPRIHRRKEILAEEGGENERYQHAGEKADHEERWASEREDEECAIALADALEASLEPCLEALQWIARGPGSWSRSPMTGVCATHQVVGHG